MSETQNAPALEFKPDFAEARQRWLAFWDKDLIDRPCCVIRAPKEGVEPKPGLPYLAGTREDFGVVAQQALAHAESIYWGGEAMPCYTPSFGPDQMAAWLGAELVIPEPNFGTDWVVPCIADWDGWLPLRVDPHNYWWRRFLDFAEALAIAFEGKMLVTHVDLHSNMDTFLAMRGGEALCIDMIESAETIDQAMASIRPLYAQVYQDIYNAGRMSAAGTLGWVPVYHPVKTNTIQCDFCALIGAEHFRRWVLPALEEEAAFLEHCVYHLDGPECLVHLDDLCSIPGLDCIQWTTGARNKAFIEWMDLLKEIQAKGTSVWVPCNCDDIKVYHKELDPRLVFYDCWAPSERAADETLAWLTANT